MNKQSCASRLQAALEIRKMRQTDLCKLTGIPKSAMSQYISGAFEPKQDRVYAISKALNVSEAWLMGYDVPMDPDFKETAEKELLLFHNRFIKLCKEKGLSPTTSIQMMGLSTGNLKNWKNGRIPKPEVLEKIAGFFDVSIDYLLGTSNIKKPLVNNDEELTEYLYYLKTRPELRMLFKVSSKATKADVEQAVRIIEAIRNDKKDELPST